MKQLWHDLLIDGHQAFGYYPDLWLWIVILCFIFVVASMRDDHERRISDLERKVNKQ